LAVAEPDQPKAIEKSPSQLTGETQEFLPINEVFHGHFDLLEAIENVKLGQIERIIAIDLT
jgi:hypothetical protein